MLTRLNFARTRMRDLLQVEHWSAEVRVVSTLAMTLLTTPGCTGDGQESGTQSASCGDFVSGVGQTLHFTYTSGPRQGYDLTFTRFDEGSGAAVFTKVDNAEIEGASSANLTVQHMECRSDGIYLLSSTTTETETPSSGEPSTETYDSTYDPPYLLLPAGLKSGDSWTMISTSDLEASVAASGPVTVTVPAGTYETLELHYTSTDSGSGSKTWIAQGVGAVKTEYSELASIAAGEEARR